jgi:hypothetical protein
MIEFRLESGEEETAMAAKESHCGGSTFAFASPF